VIGVRDVEEIDREWIRAFLEEQFGSTTVVSRGVVHQADELPGFIASEEQERRGLLTYSVVRRDLEVVSLHVSTRGRGLGSRLLSAARSRAQALACRRVWLITTNDNEPAMRFYERFGLRVAAVHRGAIAESRRLKPQIAFFGVGGRPIEDEVEFELRLG
jgi:ribosomal protein S18 acetylase RimI-like enzyme